MIRCRTPCLRNAVCQKFTPGTRTHRGWTWKCRNERVCANGNRRDTGAALRTLDRTDVKSTTVTREKEGHSIMISEPICQEDIIYIHMHPTSELPNTGSEHGRNLREKETVKRKLEVSIPCLRRCPECLERPVRKQRTWTMLHGDQTNLRTRTEHSTHSSGVTFSRARRSSHLQDSGGLFPHTERILATWKSAGNVQVKRLRRAQFRG